MGIKIPQYLFMALKISIGYDVAEYHKQVEKYQKAG